MASSSTTTSSGFSMLQDYEPLDIIGNGSFGVIRKVRRKADGLIFARKELNFERMTERDRKQIVSEVNILKELQHEHIVRYMDRHVDRENGILYILMEYCGGGDLSAIIKTARKTSTPLPEDAIWNYFVQILLALHSCHFPNSKPPSASFDTEFPVEEPVHKRRQQILHRDLKPDNVFLGSDNSIKLGDFGLSKQLGQASFAHTYVGTPYYMSPELINEKSYDTKSDIWSLGCLLYELCALNPPFHEAQTHSELSIMIRSGRIPPLPKGYSSALSNVIKSMLNLNPAMRPSVQQLLQHERINFAFKMIETEKMLAAVRNRREALLVREREVIQKEEGLARREKEVSAEQKRLEEFTASLNAQRAQLEASIYAAREAYASFERDREAFRLEKESWEQHRLAQQQVLPLMKPSEDTKNTVLMPTQAPRLYTQAPDDSPSKIVIAKSKPPHQKTPSDSNRLTSRSLTNLGSAMRGVILTTTGATIETPVRGHTYPIPAVQWPEEAKKTGTNENEQPPAGVARQRVVRRSTIGSASRPTSAIATAATSIPIWNGSNAPAPTYDLDDEENLPSPFIKKTLDRIKPSWNMKGASKNKRKSNGGLLAVAVTNSASVNNMGGAGKTKDSAVEVTGVPKSSVVRAGKAGDGPKRSILTRA